MCTQYMFVTFNRTKGFTTRLLLHSAYTGTTLMTIAGQAEVYVTNYFFILSNTLTLSQSLV